MAKSNQSKKKSSMEEQRRKIMWTIKHEAVRSIEQAVTQIKADIHPERLHDEAMVVLDLSAAAFQGVMLGANDVRDKL